MPRHPDRAAIIRASFRELEHVECEGMLAAHVVGRLAYTFHDRVGIEPIHFVYDSGWIYGRTSPGEKLLTLQHHPWVALEIDEIHGPFDWQSVVAHGMLHLLDESASSPRRESRARAVAALVRLMPTAFSADDPTPERTVVFGIFVDRLSGRAASLPGG